MTNHHFISYSSVDGADFALKLCDALAAGPPEIKAWVDRCDLCRASDEVEQGRIEDESDALQRQIAEKEHVVDDPQGKKKQSEESIERGLERARRS